MEATGANAARRTEQRIEVLTPCLGLLAGMLLGWLVSPVWGAGVAAGGALAWLNYRWIEQGVNALARASQKQHAERPEQPRPRVAISVGAKFVLRYVLMAIVAYAIVGIYKVPILSLLSGLFSLGAAAILAVLYEVLAPQKHGTSR